MSLQERAELLRRNGTVYVTVEQYVDKDMQPPARPGSPARPNVCEHKA